MHNIYTGSFKEPEASKNQYDSFLKERIICMVHDPILGRYDSFLKERIICMVYDPILGRGLVTTGE